MPASQQPPQLRKGQTMNPLRVTIWHEYRHEHHNDEVASIYPDGMHRALAAGLAPHGFEIQTRNPR